MSTLPSPAIAERFSVQSCWVDARHAASVLASLTLAECVEVLLDPHPRTPSSSPIEAMQTVTVRVTASPTIEARARFEELANRFRRPAVNANDSQRAAACNGHAAEVRKGGTVSHSEPTTTSPA